MKSQSINILGYTGSNSRFVVKTNSSKSEINQLQSIPDEFNPYEFVLAGFAGFLNRLGSVVAEEQGMVLKSLQVEITASVDLPEPEKLAVQRPNLSKIIISLKPSTPATVTELRDWHSEVKRRSELFNNPVMVNITDTLLFSDYSLN